MCNFLLDLDEYVDSRNFRMSVDTSCDVLVYMTILWIVDFCIHE